jgi:hypothetical protein
MALFAPRTKEEQKFQHCNYGYDTSKYKSFDDCMKNYYKFNKSDLPSTQNTDIVSESFLQKNKTNLLIIGALVLGYFAYKKFNK